MNISAWRRPTQTRLERLEDRITPTAHNVTASLFPIAVTTPTLQGTTRPVGVTPPNGPSSNNLLDLGARKAQPLASPVSPTADNSSGGGTTTPIPTMTQAWQSLFIDGAALETQRLFYQFVQDVDEFPLGSTLTDSIAKAAASGIDFNAVLALNQFISSFKDQLPDALFADIEFNLQYAGPFGLAVGVAGASAANQAAQIHSMPSSSSD